MRSRSQLGHRSRGQGLVEFALILPVMLFLLLGALDLGRVFYANITITNAAKEAAFRASTGKVDWAAAAVNEAGGGFVTVASGDVSTAYSDSTNKCSSSAAFGATVTATVTASFQFITPFLGALLGGQTRPLTAVAQANCRVVPAMALLPEPTPTPRVNCTVPDLVGQKVNGAAGAWGAAGFTGSVTQIGGSGNWNIAAQSPSSGTIACTSGVTVYEAAGPPPTPTPTPTTTPTPTPTPTPRVNCDVPNFVGANANNATQRANITSNWAAAGFTGTVTFTGSGNSVTAQSLPPGSSACTSSIILTR